VIHPTAIVHPAAEIGEGAEIGPYCVVGENVKIGPRTKLLAHVVVGGHTTLGSETVVYPFCSLGLASQDRKYRGEPSFTSIGDRTTIREYVSVNRATGEGQVTSVGDDTLLLAYVHIAHNCRIGNNVTMSSTAQLAGHVVIEDHATIGGQTGVHQFVRIGEHAMVGGLSGVRGDVPPYVLVAGNPAQPFGLNSVGLRRAGFAPEVLAELKECYKLMYRSGHNVTQAVEALRSAVKTSEGKHFLAFVETDTERGIVK
jgi:UDP-N-acetylglucosamine acyltransferase